MRHTYSTESESLKSPRASISIKKEVHLLTEERSFQRRKAGKLVRIRELSSEEEDPIRILGIVVDAHPDSFLVQDIYDEVVDDREKIWVYSETPLEQGKKYMLIGRLVHESLDEEEGLRMTADVALGIDGLNINLYRNAVELETDVLQTLGE